MELNSVDAVGSVEWTSEQAVVAASAVAHLAISIFGERNRGASAVDRVDHSWPLSKISSVYEELFEGLRCELQEEMRRPPPYSFHFYRLKAMFQGRQLATLLFQPHPLSLYGLDSEHFFSITLHLLSSSFIIAADTKVSVTSSDDAIKGDALSVPCVQMAIAEFGKRHAGQVCQYAIGKDGVRRPVFWPLTKGTAPYKEASDCVRRSVAMVMQSEFAQGVGTQPTDFWFYRLERRPSHCQPQQKSWLSGWTDWGSREERVAPQTVCQMRHGENKEFAVTVWGGVNHQGQRCGFLGINGELHPLPVGNEKVVDRPVSPEQGKKLAQEVVSAVIHYFGQRYGGDFGPKDESGVCANWPLAEDAAVFRALSEQLVLTVAARIGEGVARKKSLDILFYCLSVPLFDGAMQRAIVIGERNFGWTNTLFLPHFNARIFSLPNRKKRIDATYFAIDGGLVAEVSLAEYVASEALNQFGERHSGEFYCIDPEEPMTWPISRFGKPWRDLVSTISRQVGRTIRSWVSAGAKEEIEFSFGRETRVQPLAVQPSEVSAMLVETIAAIIPSLGLATRQVESITPVLVDPKADSQEFTVVVTPLGAQRFGVGLFGKLVENCKGE